MSTWMKENKASMVAGGVGFVLFAGLLGAGIYASLEEGDIFANIKSANETMESHMREPMPPTADVLKDLKAQLKEYEGSMKEADNFFAPFVEASVLGSENAQGFQNSLKQDRDAWLELCKSKNVVVKNEAAWMGFDAFRASAPPEKAAAMLSFEKAGMNYLLNELAKSGATTISSIYRAPIDDEVLEQKTPEKPASRSLKGQAPNYTMMPIEVSFVGDRQSVGAFLNALTSSEKYFFTINGLRVKNEKQALPVINLPKQESASAPQQIGIGLAVEPKSDKKEANAAPQVEEILKPLSGREKVQVRVAVNLVFFSGNQNEKAKSE